MKLVKVKESFYELCKNNGCDSELMFNEQGRPCVLIVKLKYKNRLQKFVVPLRSNISSATPKNQYLSLPPNSNTKPKHRHGIHYIKLFPITNAYIDLYNINRDAYMQGVVKFINNKEAEIITNIQKYLMDCENGNKHNMTPQIDEIMELLTS